ncbi:small integral membrane protein 12-A [Anopheles arabiensis]|uniref:AGAP006409-PA n=5 Tax=gambiae species complex TaxID=44542 RepID=A0NES5_ANOGA|nr:small integral membrane protein 12-A [Anopheles gambiae]XP_040152251.1 small integral membrane protein 12-A [Anopheles arabiensis]XP_040152252.1 small integral membrane protein 12-A [Anopheles arabiensis]XP_040222542.1 small integral membrane protein 12-A [Anopheles coluzzii]XP_041770902.1 small integral membrane protein 12-A [Anopheles merus]XP_049464008.1 small integral membrane protein 12-A [Anopheles coluzzii]XP_061501074.1 small integral membrane protein 12-A [Anopheles gambiae]EAU76
MWPLIMQFMRSNAAYITLPIATLVGVIGYNIESLLSDKYTPYSPSIQEKRAERITDDERLKAATDVEKLVYKENVLGRNLSPSLEKGK